MTTWSAADVTRLVTAKRKKLENPGRGHPKKRHHSYWGYNFTGLNLYKRKPDMVWLLSRRVLVSGMHNQEAEIPPTLRSLPKSCRPLDLRPRPESRRLSDLIRKRGHGDIYRGCPFTIRCFPLHPNLHNVQS